MNERKGPKLKFDKVIVSHDDLDHRLTAEQAAVAAKVRESEIAASVREKKVFRRLGMLESMMLSLQQSARIAWSNASHEPARWGLFILNLVTKASERESVLGDAREQFSRNSKRFGLRSAQFTFWWDVLVSTIHFAWRPIATTLGMLGLGKLLGRL